MIPSITYDDAKHKYLVNGQAVPSVTQILGIVDKSGPLTWWAQRIGVEGVCKLHSWGEDLSFDDPDRIVSLITAKKISVNHVKSDAATRGTALHAALEAYVKDGYAPNPADFPVESRGYVQALAKAMLALRPKVIDTEVMVASAEHGYAGRYDLFCELADGRLARVDLKTSKRIYPESHYPQIAAYEHAAVECGGNPSDVQLILRLGADGDFEVGESYATIEDFLAVKACFDAVQGLKHTGQRLRREAKAAAAAKRVAVIYGRKDAA